jgi:hypothetical protein
MLTGNGPALTAMATGGSPGGPFNLTARRWLGLEVEVFKKSPGRLSNAERSPQQGRPA